MAHDGSANGKVSPAAFPPPVDSRKEFVKRGLDPEDELIEVGVVIVGGGTAGLACANRLLQLLADDPEMMERLGEVPVAVVEKAKTCGGHNLTGAVMRPQPLQELFPDMTREQWREEGFAFGEVTKESVYMLTSSKTKLPVPIPGGPELQEPRQRGRVGVRPGALPAAPGRGGRRLHPHRDRRHPADRRGRPRRRRALRRQGTRQGRRAARQLRARDRHQGQGDGARRGLLGHLTGAAIKEFDLAENREPQVWELGVKEVWKVPKPLDRVIHTFVQPWPLKVAAKYGQLGGTWIYPMKDEKTGEDLVSIGFVVDLNYRDATTSAHDLLQTFKTHPLVKDILEGGERVAWGAKALPGGGYWSMPKLSMPGAVLVGDAGGMVDTAALKGVHHCIKSGMLAAESIYAALKRGSSDFSDYEDAVERSTIGTELYQVRNTRQAFQKGFLIGSLLAGPSIMSKGKVPPGRQQWHRDDAETMFVGNTKDRYPKPDGKYIFDKLSSVFITGNATRDDAPNHIRVQKRVPREIAETWRWMCPAGVYEIPEDAPETGDVDVIVNYTNCVQCGAITAKGGRLTTPEGGDGPLYQVT